MQKREKKTYILTIPLSIWVVIWFFSFFWHVLFAYFFDHVSTGLEKPRPLDKAYEITLVSSLEEKGASEVLSEQEDEKEEEAEKDSESEEESEEDPQKEVSEGEPSQALKDLIQEIIDDTPEENEQSDPNKKTSSGDSLSIVGIGESSPGVKDSEKLVDILTGGKKSAYHHRNKKDRKRYAKKYGGSQASENSVEMGLAWLIRHQDKDGGWSSEKFHKHCRDKSCWGRGYNQHSVGLTSLSLLSFLAAGYSPKEGKYKKKLLRTQEYLLRDQNEDGYFGNYEMYNHGVSLLALSELYVQTQDVSLRSPLRRAVQACVDAQRSGGGWTYKATAKTNRNDSSISGWQILGLAAAKRAGIQVPNKTFDRAWKHFLRMTNSVGEVYYSNVDLRNLRRPSRSLSAVSLLCSVILNRPNPFREKQIQILKQFPPDWKQRRTLNNSIYYWYHGTLALFLIGGEPWDKWNAELRDMLILHQVKSGEAKGSWPPDSKWGSGGGRIYSTAINTLNLEIYYRYDLNFIRIKGE